MSYSATTVAGETVFLKKLSRKKPEYVEGVEALLQSAWPYYNRALQKCNDGNVPAALEAAQIAVRQAPFSTRIVELNLLLSLQHGDFERARQLIAWGDETGMAEKWPAYKAHLTGLVSVWNTAVSNPASLREKYRVPTTPVCYRELLLLADWAKIEGVDLSDTERSFLEAYDIPFPHRTPASGRGAVTRRWLVNNSVGTTAFAAFAGLLIGAWLFYMIDIKPPPSPTPEVQPVMEEVESTYSGSIAALASVNLALAQGKPGRAHAVLQEVEADNLTGADMESYEALREATDRALFNTGTQAWREEDYQAVVDMLEPLLNKSVGKSQQKYYFLGIAAYKVGSDSLAVESLLQLQDHLDADHPHFDAQAAYALVQLLPPSDAQHFARRVAERYPDTPYNNSIVRGLL